MWAGPTSATAEASKPALVARRAGASRHRLAARWRASVAATIEEVFIRTRTVIVVLLNEAVTDLVLHRGTPRFTRRRPNERSINVVR